MNNSSSELARLGALIQTFAPYDGDFPLRVPSVAVARSGRTHQALVHSVQKPTLCIVAQGNKAVHIGTETYEYNPQRMMLYAVHLPIAFQVTQASPQRPFLTFKLDLDPQRIAELSIRAYPHGLPRIPKGRGVQVTDADPAILATAICLLELMGNEREAAYLGPLLIDELLMRLLLGPAGALVAQMGGLESKTGRVERAIGWIQQHFDEPLDVEILAEMAHMGVSTFHAQFKAVTGFSPLQFQKNLRLQDARRLLQSSGLDAASVSRQVGYASASQFSREYTRFFGTTPRRDMEQLRNRHTS